MDFTWGIFLKKNKNKKSQICFGNKTVTSNILINHLRGLLLKGFDNQDAYTSHVVIITFSRK